MGVGDIAGFFRVVWHPLKILHPLWEQLYSNHIFLLLNMRFLLSYQTQHELYYPVTEFRFHFMLLSITQVILI